MFLASMAKNLMGVVLCEERPEYKLRQDKGALMQSQLHTDTAYLPRWAELLGLPHGHSCPRGRCALQGALLLLAQPMLSTKYEYLKLHLQVQISLYLRLAFTGSSKFAMN